MVDADPTSLGALASRVAAQAAELLLQGLALDRSPISTKSSVTDLVTQMDRRAEELIVTELRRARPDDAVLGEEGGAREGMSGVRWLVDPIDGTTNYHYGFPGFAVSVAAEADGRTVAGAVADPMHGDLFEAVLGGGARCNGGPIHVTDKDDLATSLVGTGFSYEASRRQRQAEVLTTVLPRVRDIRRVGAAAVDLCWVGCGRLDGFYERGLAPWDMAAGGLVAAEAGALVTDLDGGGPSTEFVLAATPSIHGSLRQLLLHAGADTA